MYKEPAMYSGVALLDKSLHVKHTWRLYEQMFTLSRVHSACLGVIGEQPVCQVCGCRVQVYNVLNGVSLGTQSKSVLLAN